MFPVEAFRSTLTKAVEILNQYAVPRAVTLSGKDGDDAKAYQEKQVKRAIEEVEQ